MTEVLYIFPHLICITWSVYNCIKLFSHTTEEFLQKRSLFLVFGYNTSLILGIINITFTTIANVYLSPSIRQMGYGFSMITTYLILFFLNVKAWMIYYQYQWTFHALQLKWQQIINPNVLDVDDDQHQINWFILNRQKYGNLQYVYKIFGFIHLIFAIICCLCIWIFIPSHHITLRIIGIILLILITLTTLIFYTFVIRNTPPFDDIYYIHRENKILAPVLLIGLILYVIISITEAYFNRMNHSTGSILGNVAQIEILLMWTILSYISTSLIIKKNHDYWSSLIKEIDVDKLQKNIIVADKLKKCDLQTVLSQTDSIDSFMKYLSREFSMENLLFIIETTDYQRHLLADYTVDDEISKLCGEFIEFPENVPASIIVDSQWAPSFNDKLHDPKIKAYKIYQKYVKIGAEFEINISSDQRKKITKKLNDYNILLENKDININNLFLIFNDCKLQVTTLLNHSLTRFKNESNHINATAHAQIVVHPTDLSTNM